MSFNNSGHVPLNLGNLGRPLASMGRPPVANPPKNLPLNSPMVNRVHNAKPGCSACGKKVA